MMARVILYFYLVAFAATLLVERQMSLAIGP